MLLFSYFEPMKDGTSNACKQASSVVLKHASFRVLGVTEKEVIKRQKFNLPRMTKSASFATLASTEIDRP